MDFKKASATDCAVISVNGLVSIQQVEWSVHIKTSDYGSESVQTEGSRPTIDRQFEDMVMGIKNVGEDLIYSFSF